MVQSTGYQLYFFGQKTDNNFVKNVIELTTW